MNVPNNHLGDPTPVAERVILLREALQRRHLDGFIVPHADEFGNEFPPTCYERLSWLTGFTGSFGFAVVLADRAALFTDGRYTLQAAQQVDKTIFQVFDIRQKAPTDWIVENVVAEQVLGFDPWILSQAQYAHFKTAVEEVGAKLIWQQVNPIDPLWHNRPAPPTAKIVRHPVKFAGRRHKDKIADLAADLKRQGIDALLLNSPHSIAWLFNIRGSDVDYTPVALLRAIVTADGAARIFCHYSQVSPFLTWYLGEKVELVVNPDAFEEALGELAAGNKLVSVDYDRTPQFVAEYLREKGVRLLYQPDPCVIGRAIKNDVELAGMSAAHLRDGVAVTRFIAWLKFAAPQETVTEIDAADVLLSLRSEEAFFVDLSFPTICASGAHGAIIHYQASAQSNCPIAKGTLCLVDSGGQYRDGTTDVTRTVAIGRPSQEMKELFTRVLKGHIALAMARFPERTSGHALDVLARQFLWQVGLDYGHGTGHGIGSFLGVHEGPHAISQHPSDVPLEPGMVVSNEPGFYREGEFGIRIESVVAVQPVTVEGAEFPVLGFETLTLVPIDLDLVDTAFMTKPEIDWLNAYHARVRDALLPHLDDTTKQWLWQATRPVYRQT